jgi:hypothetical protein
MRMPSPCRDYAFFSILKASDPEGYITKEIRCTNPSCGKRFHVPAIEYVPQPDDFDPQDVFGEEGDSDEVDESRDVVIDSTNTGAESDDYDLSMTDMPIRILGDVFSVSRSRWKQLEYEREFVLRKPFTVTLPTRSKSGKISKEPYNIQKITLRVQNASDEIETLKMARHLSRKEMERRLIATRVVAVDGVPDKLMRYIRSTSFVKRLHKVDQKAIEEWDNTNRVLELTQVTMCPDCGSMIAHIWDAGFFF